MAILTTPDKEKIKRAVPKANNKVIDATVARLYVAYPDPTQWTYTGLVGAITLVDDLVGHTFFLKLVDILGHRGVVWDQELYVNFEYNQDRKFFHTFEIEDCLVGLLFEDTNDAAHFHKRVTTRQKHGSKQTVNNKNAIALKERAGPSANLQPGPRGEFVDLNTAQRSRRSKGVLYYDDVPPPEWRSLYAELEAAGISEDMIADNREFIKEYIAQQGGPLVGLEPPIPRKLQKKHEQSVASPARVSSSSSQKPKKAPPPPPPPGGASSNAASSPGTPTPPPAPPAHDYDDNSTDSAAESPAPEPAPEPASLKPKFRLPPANAVVPPVRNSLLPPPPPQGQQQVGAPPPLPPQNTRPLPNLPGQPPQPYHNAPPAFNPPNRGGPPPPPRANNGPPPPPRGGPVPPQRSGAVPPPPPPPRAARGGPPPPPPPRAARPAPGGGPPPPQNQYVPQAPPQPPMGLSPYNAQSPPPLPPMSSHPPPPQRTPQPAPGGPPLPPAANGGGAPPPPPPPPPMPSMTSGGPPPPAPPPPQMAANGPPPPAPPPPQMAANGPPPPPPPPDMSSSTPAEATGDPSRDALLASIRGAGLGMLKKTDKSQLERPSVLLQEAKGEPVAPPAGGPAGGSAGGQPATLADALASALSKRKNKVAQSDDEDEDDW
ncbi:WH1-domain-containing protein [Suhomyces tanzawaensis NRRL Y-17324]|uniref:WH1-domain-containing protein n=1 Tax=Suhomyces tanzawaensis NRRL Y-17324 TaxID=984487 RepID=A0A1E4SNX7_9ASCO|nr:WH1-domain-containing protein [Suhomyces tanzawaensis NRRL Y-17324]ODV81092.1 WH1-domain-containing protein [Suhomyces tanzawaensis NRRL Y-17324]